MKAAINQPTYLPWIGYFDLIDQVDVFILLDNVQFGKRSWQQRNRVRMPDGLQWLTVPVKTQGRFGQRIHEVEISEPEFWHKHTRTIEIAYSRTPYFAQYFPGLAKLLEDHSSGLLVELSVSLIRWFCAALEISTPLIVASSLNQSGKRTELLANLCTAVGANEYISPAGSVAYLAEEENIMRQRGIDVRFQNYCHPVYRQDFDPFLPYASVIDLLFNQGPESGEILRSGRRPCCVAADLLTQAAG